MEDPKKEKRYIVRKFVMARSAQEALKLEHDLAADDVFVDDGWAKGKEFSSAPGFRVDTESETTLGQPNEDIHAISTDA